MESIFILILNMSITASFIAIAVIILRLFLKKAPRWITLLLWLFVAIRLVMPFSFESALSLIPRSEVIAPHTVYSEIQGADPHLFYEDDGELPLISDDPEADAGNSQESPSLSIPFVASLLWVAGIVGMLLYTVISYSKIKRRVAASIEVEKGIYICDNIDTPFILGVMKPRIYLPSTLTESEKEYVIAHERAHLGRGDHLIKPLSFLLLSVYWFNPILWVSYILLSKDIEIACDQKVIRDMDIENKKDYSTTLLNLSTQRRLISACPLAFGEVGVKQRISNILSYKKPAFWIMVVSVILCIAVAVCFLTNPLSGTKPKVLDGGSDLQGLSVDVLKIDKNDKGYPVIKVKFRNENDFELTCGDEFYIYKEVDGKWVNCREGDYAFTLIGYDLKAKGSLTHEYGLRYVDMTSSGKYRFESKAVRSEGVTEAESYKVWADFEIKKGIEGSGEVVYNFAMGSYVCRNSNEPLATKPYIYLDPDGSFTSHFSAFSSTIYGGEYKAENNKLTLTEKHPDPLLPGKYIEGDRFVFNIIDEKTLQFVESESASVGKYRYAEGEAPKAPFEDGAIFELESKSNTDIIQGQNINISFEALENLDLYFTSGAGAWYSSIHMNEDGNFVGEHHDANGDTVYKCDYSGKFSNLQKLDDYTYSLTLYTLNCEGTRGDSYTENGIKYVTSYPYGLTESRESINVFADEFLLFLPNTPTNAVPSEALNWWPLKSSDSKPDTLSLYCIYNVSAKEAFFTHPILETTDSSIPYQAKTLSEAIRQSDYPQLNLSNASVSFTNIFTNLPLSNTTTEHAADFVKLLEESKVTLCDKTDVSKHYVSLRIESNVDLIINIYDNDVIRIGYSYGSSDKGDKYYKSEGIYKKTNEYTQNLKTYTDSLYTINYDKYIFNCTIKATDGSILERTENPRQPHFELIDKNLIFKWEQNGTGTLTRSGKIYNLKTKEVFGPFIGKSDYHNGKICTSGSGEVRITLLSNPKYVQIIDHFEKPVSSFIENIYDVYFTPDGKQVAVVYYSGEYQNGEEVVAVTEYFDVEL